MIKITTIFGEDAVREYEENNELPSEEWLADNGGVVDEKEFETEAEYNAYIAGVNLIALSECFKRDKSFVATAQNDGEFNEDIIQAAMDMSNL